MAIVPSGINETATRFEFFIASYPTLVVAFAFLAVLRATVVQTPIANRPIVAALAMDPGTTRWI